MERGERIRRLERLNRIAATAWGVLAGGTGAGFVARDLIGAPPTAVALAWVAGALMVALVAFAAARRGGS
jgi:hypothetical protein